MPPATSHPDAVPVAYLRHHAADGSWTDITLVRCPACGQTWGEGAKDAPPPCAAAASREAA